MGAGELGAISMQVSAGGDGLSQAGEAWRERTRGLGLEPLP